MFSSVLPNFVSKGRQFDHAIETYLRPDFSEARITTITSFAKLETTICPQDTGTHPDDNTTTKKRPRDFYNSTMFRDGNKSVKVFRTGLHITGCNRFEDITNIITNLTSTPPLSIDVQLLNILVNFNKDLFLHHLCERFRSTYDCLYDRDRYCGLRIKVPSIISPNKKTTLLLFPSGKAMITGIRHPEDIQNIHTNILSPIKYSDTRI